MAAEISIRRLSEIPMNEAVFAWNEGFSDYYVNIPLTLQQFAAIKFGVEEIDPEHSFYAYVSGKPAGFILSAFRTGMDGDVFAWNGGTAVLPEFRRIGVGKALMERAIEAYREKKVGTALLEAFVQNERAIPLYRSYGYEVFDTVNGFAVGEGFEPSWGDFADRYSFERVPARALSLLPFYPKLATWQTQWRSGRDGEAVVLRERDGDGGDSGVAGFALFRRVFDASGKHTATSLLQAVCAPGRDDEELVLRAALEYVFARQTELAGLRRIVNAAPSSQATLVELLSQLGLERRYQLVHMALKL